MFSVAVLSLPARILSQFQWRLVSMVTRCDVISRRWSSHFWVKVHVFSTFFNNNLMADIMQSVYLCVIFHGKHKKITISRGFNLIVGFHMTSLKFKLQTIDLLRFYFHDVLEQLKTNFQTNFRFKRVLGFIIEYAWISTLLRDAAFTWRPRELSFRLKKWLFSRNFAI